MPVKKNKTKVKRITPVIEKINNEEPKKSKKLDYLIRIIVNLLLLNIFNNFSNWDLQFITADFRLLLPFINFSIKTTIGVNFLLILYDQIWFRLFTKIVLNIIGVIFMYLLYQIFPFDLPNVGKFIFKLCLYIGFWINLILAMVNIFRLLILRNN